MFKKSVYNVYIVIYLENGMEKIKRKFSIYAIAALTATLICVLLRSVCVFCFYDLHIGYYMSGEALPIIFNIFLILVIAFSSFFTYLINKIIIII